jgi:hypothetical protein
MNTPNNPNKSDDQNPSQNPSPPPRYGVRPKDEGIGSHTWSPDLTRPRFHDYMILMPRAR